MSWIQTYTGRKFHPLVPRAEDIDLLDIAHSLANQCRFNGHCREFYSVAEHSVRVAMALPADLRAWGLLHDAAEAYLSDLPRPLKLVLPEYEGFELHLLEVISKRFGLEWPMPPAVRQADDVLLATEARDLMVPPPSPWARMPEPLSERIKPWPHYLAEVRFQNLAADLGFSLRGGDV